MPSLGSKFFIVHVLSQVFAVVVPYFIPIIKYVKIRAFPQAYCAFNTYGTTLYIANVVGQVDMLLHIVSL